MKNKFDFQTKQWSGWNKFVTPYDALSAPQWVLSPELDRKDEFAATKQNSIYHQWYEQDNGIWSKRGSENLSDIEIASTPSIVSAAPETLDLQLQKVLTRPCSITDMISLITNGSNGNL